MKKYKIVVLTGAGISQESGIMTFRDANGLWQNHDIMEVASPEGWHNNPELVLEFYNQRRRQLHQVQPNVAHLAITELQKFHEVHVVTQNVDDLHERAGNKNVLHLHGELLKARSEKNNQLIYEWKNDLNLSDLADDDSQLRPHIVWFGEDVPEIKNAAKLVSEADIFIIVGTGMQVYPAAGLVGYLKPETPIYYIDPDPSVFHTQNPLQVFEEKAGEALPKLVEKLIKK